MQGSQVHFRAAHRLTGGNYAQRRGGEWSGAKRKQRTVPVAKFGIKVSAPGQAHEEHFTGNLVLDNVIWGAPGATQGLALDAEVFLRQGYPGEIAFLKRILAGQVT